MLEVPIRGMAMSLRTVCVLLLVVAGVAGCGPHVPTPATVVPGAPRISWIIMSGDRDNPDREFVCQSDPRTACEVPASQPASQVFSHLYVYYHPAAMETLYTGSIRVGFFGGDGASPEIKPRITVGPKEKLANQTVMGIVSTMPGTFPLTFDIVATPTGSSAGQPVRDSVDVIVK
jgi:hypothetical protein